ncbi:MAG: hypothetical protein AAGC55_20945, partial [Myxococcota bacterium]
MSTACGITGQSSSEDSITICAPPPPPATVAHDVEVIAMNGATWFFRGTPNDWATTAMEQVGNSDLY